MPNRIFLYFDKTMMRFILFAFVFLFSFLNCTSEIIIKEITEDQYSRVNQLIEKLGIDKYLDQDIFRMATAGYFNIQPENEKLIIVDYSKNSYSSRFFVIDMKQEKILYKCLVSHGKNSGFIKPTKFSNVSGSKKSSLGFFKTAETYTGKHGLSLKLDGLENGINDNARSRAIVIHTADYVSLNFIKSNGYLGRSWGCPALPKDNGLKIIDEIKDGACLFIYANEKDYFKTSKFFAFAR